MNVDAFGFVGFNADETLRGRWPWLAAVFLLPSDSSDPENIVVTTDVDGIASVEPVSYYFFAPGSLSVGVMPWPDAGSAKSRFFSFVATENTPAGNPRVAVEFVHEPSGNYFVTQDDAEIETLDAEQFTGWSRSIGSLIVYADGDAPAGTVPVCRFFSRQFTSHFYSANADECADVARRWPEVWTLETSSAFRVFVPDVATGECPPNTWPVYRLFNDKATVNHRYVTDRELRNTMASAGWIPEGHGREAVAMCSPK